MVKMILNKTGVLLLTILKWLLQAGAMILNLLFFGIRLFLLLFALVARIVLSVFRIAG